MRRRLAFAAFAALIAVAAALGPAGGSVAHAGTRSPDDLADRYGLLREGDLPTGYGLDSVRRETGAIAGYFAAEGDCARINTAVKFFDGDPVISQATFEEATANGARGGEGSETVYAFGDDDVAKEFYARFAPNFDELVECGLMTDAVGNIGTYTDLPVGKVGDQRTAIAFDPRADRYTRLGLTRNDDVVIYVVLYDDEATDDEFTALLKQAVKRAR